MQRFAGAPKRRRLGTLLFVGALLGAPFVAIAALAPYDLVGKRRTSPTAIGALEVDSSATRPTAPTGLTITRIPN